MSFFITEEEPFLVHLPKPIVARGKRLFQGGSLEGGV